MVEIYSKSFIEGNHFEILEGLLLVTEFLNLLRYQESYVIWITRHAWYNIRKSGSHVREVRVRGLKIHIYCRLNCPPEPVHQLIIAIKVRMKFLKGREMKISGPPTSRSSASIWIIIISIYDIAGLRSGFQCLTTLRNRKLSRLQWHFIFFLLSLCFVNYKCFTVYRIRWYAFIFEAP